MYYGGTSVTCYNGQSNKTTTCPTNTIDETAKTLIDNHIWNTGAIEYNTRTDTLAFYKDERGTKTGKICSSGAGCNDTVERTTEWPGYIGLAYATDYAYASSESDCNTNMVKQDSNNVYICKNNNWMFKPNTWNWTLSPYALPGNAVDVWRVRSDGGVGNYFASSTSAVFPTIYLKSNILIESGTGSTSDPYVLKLGN